MVQYPDQIASSVSSSPAIHASEFMLVTGIRALHAKDFDEKVKISRGDG
jgi:predicted alpha/beta superfamily hydrolase